MRILLGFACVLVLSFGVQGGAFSFTNTTVITIPDAGAGTPYPSSIAVSGVTGTVTQVAATLIGLTHTFPADLDILLVSPTNARVMLMSDAGGGNNVNNVTIALSDSAAGPVPGVIVSGTYRPTDANSGDSLPAPAPGLPYSASMAVFTGTDPNGVWALYVYDDASEDVGTLTGWRLDLTTSEVSTPEPANMAMAVMGLAALGMLRRRRV